MMKEIARRREKIPKRKSDARTSPTGHSSEYERFERMMRGLLKVPKKAINGQGGKAKKKAS